ncbi:exocyst complex component 3 [Anguilla rostrata]|uniref:exocyst complex component 3 n=1 Tax=Anguilla rostrata TaxID=7938 RepID=UPI0030D40796
MFLGYRKLPKCKERTWTMKRIINAMPTAQTPSQKTKKPETLGSDKATPAEVTTETSQCLRMALEVLYSEKAGGVCAEFTPQKLKELYQVLCSIMNNALLGESPSVEELRIASQVIAAGQKYHGVCQQEEWSPKNWFNMFTQLVEQAVIKKIPQPPLKSLGSGHPEKVLAEYLQLAQKTVLEELKRLSPGLRETPLLDCVVENFHLYIFAQLDQVLNCTLTADKINLVLYWVARVYLSEKSMGHPDIKDNCFRAVDMLVLSDWLQRAEKMFLTAIQEVVSERLHSILQNEKIYWGTCIPGDEEDFIKLQIDVIQVLQGFIEPAGMISKQLKVKVQEICYPKLLVFLEKYVEREQKRLKMHAKSGEMYPFRTFSTSMELRKYVQKIASNRNDESIKAVHSLKSIEAQSLALVLKKPFSKAEASLKEYFKKGDGHRMGEMEEIKMHFRTLPKMNQEAYKIAVDTAYDRLTSLYLKYLLQSNKSELERTWSDVGSEVTENAEYLHNMFSHLNPEVIQRNQALLNVGKILKCSDINALKITIAEMRIDCPDMSQEQVRILLRWKGLSQSQVKEVLDASQECLYTIDLPNKPRWYRYCCCY